MKELTPETARNYCEIAEKAAENGETWTPELGDLTTEYAFDFAPVFRACDAYEIESIKISYAQNARDFVAAFFVEIRLIGFWVSVAFAENEDDFSAIVKIRRKGDYKSVSAVFEWVVGPKCEGFFDDNGNEIGAFITAWINANK